MRMVVWVVILAVVAGLAYVRLAPHDVERQHQPIAQGTDTDFDGGAVRTVEGPEALLSAADRYMQSLPRTSVLAGDVASGRITYVTRSKIIGFPDYTTLEYADGRLKAYARLRFGTSDLGVNRDRLEGLLATLQ